MNDAAPHAWAELSHGDAERLGVTDGDLVRVRTRRGSVEVPVRVTTARDGVVFVPFHYGHRPDGSSSRQAANALTLFACDPVSKQPLFKSAAANVERVNR